MSLLDIRQNGIALENPAKCLSAKLLECLLGQ